MKIDWLKKWNERYQQTEYVYGEEPNEFLKEQLPLLEPGKVLFGAEGEGRNAVYAAKNGWDVTAFDTSKEGKVKALRLAKKNGVILNYRVGELPTLKFEKDFFDAIVLIYAHFPAEIKSSYHKILSSFLKRDGIVIFEAFGKNHLKYREENPRVGGPRNLDTLFSIEEIKEDFRNYEIAILEEKVIELKEGLYHNGKGSVVRFVGMKK